MGNKEVKLKIEVGDYKFECKGVLDAMVDLAIQNLQNYKKTCNVGY